MNTYVNIKTGASFQTECKCSGDKWELVTTQKKDDAKEEKKPAKRTKK